MTIGSRIASHTRLLVILQLIFGAIVPIVAMFFLPIYQASWHENRYDAAREKYVRSTIEAKRNMLNERIAVVGANALALSTQASELFTYSDRYGYTPTLHRTGGTYRNKPAAEPASVFANMEMSYEARRKVGRLLLLEPFLQSSAASPFTVSGFVYIDDPMVLVSPARKEAIDEYNSTDDASLYEQFRKNPRKQWRLYFDKNPVVAAPVFAAANLIGVAGYELNKKLFTDILSEMPSEKGNFSAIVSTSDGKVLHGVVPRDFNLEKYRDGAVVGGFRIIEARLETPPLAIVFGAPIDVVDAEKDKLYDIIFSIAFGVSAFVLLFYIILALRSKRAALLLTDSITRPLNIVSRFLYRIGSRKSERIEATGVTEIDDLANHMRLAHSKIVETTTIDGVTKLENRRSLEEDLDGKRAFSIAVIGVHFEANSMQFFAANNFVMKRAAEIAKKLLPIESAIYAIGANKLAVLIGRDDKEFARNCAQKIANAIENSEFLFNDELLKVSAVFGIASAEKGSTKLIDLAEQEMTK